jgi:outer membrane protein assembly factor BamB
MTEKEATSPAHVTPAAAVTGLTEAAPPPAPVDVKQPDRTLRLWPGVLIVALMWAGKFLPSVADVPPNVMMLTVFLGPLVATVLVAIWYVFLSRRPWAESLGIPAGLAVIAAAGIALSHPTFRGFGHMLYVLPFAVTVWVGWLLLTGWMSWPARRVGLLAVWAILWGGFALVRFDGTWGDFSAQMQPRWTETEEEKRRKVLADEQPPPKQQKQAIQAGPSDWVGFRGAKRDGVLTGFKVGTDWESDPPKELWKQRIGPGWGSFTVVGDRAYTQEQRGENEEAVVCLDANTGKTLWVHTDEARFYEAVGGPGPRATPTFHGGRLYAVGAKGVLNCLDPSTGERLWHQDIAKDSGAKVPTWGFSASPFVAHGLVTVYAGGKGGKAVVAYDAVSGELKWTGGEGYHSYASTQLMTLCGKEVLAVTSAYGLTGLDPKTGKVLLDYEWMPSPDMARCCQPMAVGPDEVVFGAGFGEGTRKLKLSPSQDGTLTAEEVWATKRLNPYFNDHVAYKGHLYGISGETSAAFLVCIDLATGEQKWKTRGYDAGQVMLLSDQGLLLVVSEKGKVALVRASPERHERVAQIDAISGKTWNHPAVAGGRLFVRNGEWAAAFQLPAAK